MGYESLAACVADLERHGHLARIEVEVDADLEAAEIHRRVYQAGGPALYFSRVKGSAFPMVSNLFGTLPRARFMFRDALRAVTDLVALKANPTAFMRAPWRFARAGLTALHMLPKRVGSGPVLARTTSISALPQLRCWPLDGGAFITLPQVYTEDPDAPGPMRSNLGMYRIQLSGGSYDRDREVGLHYQIHRGIGVHQQAAQRRGEPLRVSVFVGGSPAMMLAAVMPLPEGLSELMFAGALNRRRVRLATPPSAQPSSLPVHAEADFCLTGTVDSERLLAEGPFGDHLGYYSLAHDFPVLRVESVHHREHAIWPFTVVGRPPQEDTTFGALIHELTGPVIPSVVPGIRAVHAVDAAGVHPLLLAIGSERYTPYQKLERPQELLTQANAVLGQGQMSLAKYLLIANSEDAPGLDIHDVREFLTHVLRRFDPRRDLHFQTETTIDTLDYSGAALHRGSKLVLAAVGEPVRSLAHELPAGFTLPSGFTAPAVCLPGVLAVTAPRAGSPSADTVDTDLDRLCRELVAPEGFPLIVLCDDSAFCARSIGNFVWVTFTRSNPAHDVHGAGSFTRHKHWGCAGPLVIDARLKPGLPPVLESDPAISARVESLAARGGPLHGLF